MLELEHQQLAEQFHALLSQQQQAEKTYAQLLPHVTDPGDLAQLEHIHRDKRRHIQLTQRLLEIVQ